MGKVRMDPDPGFPITDEEAIGRSGASQFSGKPKMETIVGYLSMVIGYHSERHCDKAQNG